MPEDAVGPHPSIAQRSLVLHAGHGSGVEVDELDRQVVGSVAVPLRRAAHQAGLLAELHAAGLGVVLPPQAYLNQVPHGERGSGFDALGLTREPLDPDAQQWSDGDLADYAEDALDAQLSAGATLALTPAHVLAAEGGRGRAQELRLTQATVAAWNARQGWRPPPQRPDAFARELHASIVVQARDVEDASAALIDAYARLDVAGYWLVVMNAGTSTRQLGAVTRLALGLQRATGRPVTVTGAGSIDLALLASGVAAVCAGLHGMGATFPPRPIAKPDAGVGVHTFHRAILSSLPLGGRAAMARTRLFREHPCRCGAHPASEPPEGRTATIAHNRLLLQQEAREAAGMPPVIAEHRLQARARRASVLRRELGLPPLAAGWRGVAEAAQQLRASAGPDALTG